MTPIRVDRSATQAPDPPSAGKSCVMTASTNSVPSGAARAKDMARRLRTALASRDLAVSHSDALELVAQAHGVRDWNTFAATAGATTNAVGRPAEPAVVPILRVFDREQAHAFYVGYLGFTWEWEDGPAEHHPLYAQVTRGPIRLHLSEHHGDSTPGAGVLIGIPDADALHAELAARDYPYANPGIETVPWGRLLTVIDPFHNRLVFHEPAKHDIRHTPQAAGPIEHTYVVACSPEHAFEVFTSRIGTWWHPAYAEEDLVDVQVQPYAGGLATMGYADGHTVQWGTVLTWDPPGHYAQSFTLAQDPDHPSRLDLTFADNGDGTTTVEFAHDGWTAGNVAGRARFSEWPVILDRFAAAAEGRELPDGHPR
jgi:hypothetical protein